MKRPKWSDVQTWYLEDGFVPNNLKVLTALTLVPIIPLKLVSLFSFPWRRNLTLCYLFIFDVTVMSEVCFLCSILDDTYRYLYLLTVRLLLVPLKVYEFIDVCENYVTCFSFLRWEPFSVIFAPNNLKEKPLVNPFRYIFIVFVKSWSHLKDTFWSSYRSGSKTSAILRSFMYVCRWGGDRIYWTIATYWDSSHGWEHHQPAASTQIRPRLWWVVSPSSRGGGGESVSVLWGPKSA